MNAVRRLVVLLFAVLVLATTSPAAAETTAPATPSPTGSSTGVPAPGFTSGTPTGWGRYVFVIPVGAAVLVGLVIFWPRHKARRAGD